MTIEEILKELEEGKTVTLVGDLGPGKEATLQSILSLYQLRHQEPIKIDTPMGPEERGTRATSEIELIAWPQYLGDHHMADDAISGIADKADKVDLMVLDDIGPERTTEHARNILRTAVYVRVKGNKGTLLVARDKNALEAYGRDFVGWLERGTMKPIRSIKG